MMSDQIAKIIFDFLTNASRAIIDGDLDCKKVAVGLLKAFDAAGFVIVPKEPTEQMAKVGWETSANAIRQNKLGEGRLNPPVEAWKAMIAAAQEPFAVAMAGEGEFDPFKD